MKPTRRKVSMLSIVVLALVNVTARAQSPTAPAARSSPQWGTTDQILHRVGYAAFLPEFSSVPYTYMTGRYTTGGNGALLADLQLPTGALLTYFELDYCDDSPQGVLAVIRRCTFLGDGCIDLPALAYSNNGPSGCAFVSTNLTPHNIVIDNLQYAYQIVGITQAHSEDTQLIGVYIGYKLQVSPAPANATFADVPTGHQQFRFVEALFAAGITAGCGGGNFCPDAPITRGQMAVFLAAALGLHFPN